MAVQIFALRWRKIFGLFLLIFATSCLCFAFCQIWYRQQIIRVGNDLRHLETEKLVMQRKNALLRAKIARIHSPEVLYSATRTALRVPQKNQLFEIAWRDVKLSNRHLASLVRSRQNLTAADTTFAPDHRAN